MSDENKGKITSKCIFKRFNSKRQQTLHDREVELLDIAEQLVADHGFANFTMDKLTAACSYSKGTVYNHFNSKEDLIVGLCIRCLTAEIALFEQAVCFEGNLREKCLSVVYAYQKHAFEHPTLFMCVLSAKTPAVMEKASPERLEQAEQLSKQITYYCDSLFNEAIKDGALQLHQGFELNGLTFALWATAFGTNALMITAGSVESISRLEDRIPQLDNINILLDGMGWTPLSADWDYHHTWQQIQQQFESQTNGAQ